MIQHLKNTKSILWSQDICTLHCLLLWGAWGGPAMGHPPGHPPPPPPALKNEPPPSKTCSSLPRNDSWKKTANKYL